MKNLIIVSGSTRLNKEPSHPIPAIQRFDGVFIRLIRKYYRQTKNIDVLILSPVYGLISGEEKIEFKEPIGESWRELNLDSDTISKIRESNLKKLMKWLSKRNYTEIYVNVGKNMLKLIEGFEKIVPQTITVTYAQGPGIGPKMTHMKSWIESRIYKK
jgi:hypothetical protein